MSQLSQTWHELVVCSYPGLFLYLRRRRFLGAITACGISEGVEMTTSAILNCNRAGSLFLTSRVCVFDFAGLSCLRDLLVSA